MPGFGTMSPAVSPLQRIIYAILSSARKISIAAFRPLTAITLPPGWVHAPQRKTPGIGVRGSRRRSQMKSGRHSPWKMWPPVRPTAARCRAGRAPARDHRIGNVRAEPPDRAQRELLDLLPAGVPVALPEGVGDVLGEDAHRVHALGRDARVVDGLEVELGPEPIGSRPARAAVVAGLPLGLRERRVDLAEVVGLASPGPSRKSGNSRSATFSLTVQPVIGIDSTAPASPGRPSRRAGGG